MSTTLNQYLASIGRCGVASLFVLGGLNKILNYTSTLEAMRSAGLPSVELLLPGVIVLELFGGLVVACRMPAAQPIAFTLAIYTLVVNAVFHNFWAVDTATRATELSLFFKNVAIAGGLFVLASMPRQTVVPEPLNSNSNSNSN